MILIFTGPGDSTATRVEDMLRARGVEIVCFDGADFPARSGLSVELDDRGRGLATLTVAGRRIDLAQVVSVWERRPNRPEPHPRVTDPVVRQFVARESHAILTDLWMYYRGRHFPGRPDRIRAANHKTWQLRCAGEVGLTIPPTLLTNEPAAVLRFYRDHGGNLISKQGHGLPMTDPDIWARYTEPVTTRDLAHLQSVRDCPVVFQPYVPKDVEIRVTVVGRRAFAVEIGSQASARAKHDWRRYDRANTPHAVHRLPDAVAGMCVRLVEMLELHYGAIDLIRTPSGEYVFLEVNPNGQYGWMEDLSGLPISEAIADFLATGVDRS